MINHGLDKTIVGYTGLTLRVAALILFSQVDRMVDIAALAFDDVSEEEKLRYQARIKETGEYLGYKLPQYWVCGVSSTIQYYNNTPSAYSQRCKGSNRALQL